MADSKYESRKRWNAANYKQFNFSVCPKLAESYRAACENNGSSMRKVITEFMATYAETRPTAKDPNNKQSGNNNRRLRRKAIKCIINQLEEIRDAEEHYKENIPENLKGSSRYTDAEQVIEMLDGAIDLLNEAFS